jgi:hypothetical protein
MAAFNRSPRPVLADVAAAQPRMGHAMQAHSCCQLCSDHLRSRSVPACARHCPVHWCSVLSCTPGHSCRSISKGFPSLIGAGAFHSSTGCDVLRWHVGNLFTHRLLCNKRRTLVGGQCWPLSSQSRDLLHGRMMTIALSSQRRRTAHENNAHEKNPAATRMLQGCASLVMARHCSSTAAPHIILPPCQPPSARFHADNCHCSRCRSRSRPNVLWAAWSPCRWRWCGPHLAG